MFFGVGGQPVRATTASAALEGRAIDQAAVAAAQDALGEDLEPTADLHAGAATKLHLARVLTARVVGQLLGEAR